MNDIVMYGKTCTIANLQRFCEAIFPGGHRTAWAHRQGTPKGIWTDAPPDWGRSPCV